MRKTTFWVVAWPALFVAILIMGVFLPLLPRLFTHLPDLNDYPFYVWTIFQHLKHFQNGDFVNFANSNIYYPHQGTLFFSDLLIPQTVITGFWLMIVRHPLVAFNLMVISTFILNTWASLKFWQNYHQHRFIHFFLVLATVLSPYIFTQFGHLQMLSFWPLLFALNHFIRWQTKCTFSDIILTAVWLSVQFLASVYLAILGWTIVAIGMLITVGSQLFSHKKIDHKVIRSIFLLLLITSIFIGPFLLKYASVQKAYDIQRSEGEYAFYGAHVTDYLFPHAFSFSAKRLLSGWLHFNHHEIGERAAFPTITLLGLSVLGLFNWVKKKKTRSLELPIDQTRLFFIFLIIVGLVFSLGPRLNANGVFLNIPLPYYLVQRVIPIFSPIRSTARWSFLLYLGLIGSAGFGLAKIQKRFPRRASLLLGCFCLTYLIEVYPSDLPFSAMTYSSSLTDLQTTCQQMERPVLLEYPTQFELNPEKEEQQLSYKSALLLESLEHSCQLVNGYSGFQPIVTTQFYQALDSALISQDFNAVNQILSDHQITVIRVHPTLVTPNYLTAIEAWTNQQKQYTLMQSGAEIILLRNE